MTAPDAANRAALALIAALARDPGLIWQLGIDRDVIGALAGGDPPACQLTKALADTFGRATFTSAEVMQKAERVAAVASALGLRPDGLAAALAAARITTPHGFGRWAKTAPGLEQCAKDRGAAVWSVVSRGFETP